MVGEAAIIGQQLRLTVLADVPIEGGPASAVRGVAAAVEAEAAALLDPQGVAGQWTGGRRRYWVNPGAPRLMVMPSLSSVHS